MVPRNSSIPGFFAWLVLCFISDVLCFVLIVFLFLLSDVPRVVLLYPRIRYVGISRVLPIHVRFFSFCILFCLTAVYNHRVIDITGGHS